MSRSLFIGLAAAMVLLSFCVRIARAQPVTPPARVLLLLAPGASLADWRGPHTPTLKRLMETAPVALMPTRAPDSTPASAYRTIAFGTRSPGRADRSLGDTLRASGIRVTALAGPGARIVAGLPEAGDEEEAAWRVRLPEAPDGVATDPVRLADAARQALLHASAPVLVIVEFDDLARADAYARFALPRATREQRNSALRRLDTLIDRMTAPGEPFRLLLVTPRPSDAAAARGERLGPVLLWQREAPFTPTLLTSPTTRGTPGLVANTDIAATVAALLGLPQQSQAIGAGRIIKAIPAPRGEAAATYLERRAQAWAAQVREQKLLIFVPWVLAGALLLAAAWHRGCYGAVWAASVPAALVLAAPLAPEGVGQAGIVYLIAFGFSLVPPLLGLRFGPRPLLIGVCVVTTLTLLLDTLLGGPLLARSPFSYSVVEAARYYGIGNEAAGALLGAALLIPVQSVWGAALSGMVVAALLGLPRWGADFGGLIAALAGFLTRALRGVRRAAETAAAPAVAHRRQIWAFIGVAAALVAAFVYWEASRGAGARTHIGQAAAAARERGFAPLAEIAARKIAMGARLLGTSPWAVLLLTEVAVWLYLRRRGRVAAVLLTDSDAAAALRAAGVAGLAALLINDSGVVAAAACLLYPSALLLVEAGQTEKR